MTTSSSAFAQGSAVIPTSSSPGTSTTTINNYQEVTFPANDDGTWPCGGGGNASPACPGPDGETGPTPYAMGFNIDFFGTEYNSVYINNNGNLTFGAPLPTYTPADLTSFDNPIVAPFFADVDTRGAGSALVNFGTGTLNGDKVFVVNWPGVGCYNQNSSVLDNFQVILIDRADRGTGALGDDFDMEFNYDSIQWDTGQASGGDANCQNGPAGNTAYVGYSNGTTTAGDSYTLPGSGVPQTFLDSSTTTGLIYNDLNSTTLGRYLFTVNAGQPTAPTSLSTSLSGGGQSGSSVSVPSGTAVTDSALLSGANAASATGTVTYNVYSDASCTTLASAGTAESITTAGSLPASAPVTLTTPGTYYWQATYSGDASNDGSISACTPGGSGNEVETVTQVAQATSLSTSLSGGGQSGSSVSVPSGTAVTDSALLSGANAASATGTVTYNVYSDASCTTLASAGTAESITTAGSLPASAPVTLTTPGTYYWQAVYSGDGADLGSSSTCGPTGEVETVTQVSSTAPGKDGLVDAYNARGTVTARITTTVANDLLVAFVAACGPTSAAQTARVSGGGLTWTLVGRTNSEDGTSEVWSARASGVASSLPVTVTMSTSGYPVYLTVVGFTNATGTGKVGHAWSGGGVPSASLRTSSSPSWVWGVGNDPLAEIARKVPAGQTLQSQKLASTLDTFWVQSLNNETLPTGSTAKINDTAPKYDPYNLTLVEIL